MSRTKELVISDMNKAMNQIAGGYDLIEAGFKFLAENDLEISVEEKEEYRAFDNKIGLQRSAIGCQLEGSIAEAVLPDDLADMFRRK